MQCKELQKNNNNISGNKQNEILNQIIQLYNNNNANSGNSYYNT
jgi:hypothetical protein